LAWQKRSAKKLGLVYILRDRGRPMGTAGNDVRRIEISMAQATDNRLVDFFSSKVASFLVASILPPQAHDSGCRRRWRRDADCAAITRRAWLRTPVDE